LFFFGVPVFFWLRAELGGAPSPRVGRRLEWIGQWSYSIYLVHMLGIAIVAMLPLSPMPPLLRWGLGMAVILGLAYLFYRLVELPSHQLSRRAAALFAKPKASG
jgi:peptidoglycan/LPS O-acetylase OafA/YrhL